MYKNHMSSLGCSLEVASEWADITISGEIESEEEESGDQIGRRD